MSGQIRLDGSDDDASNLEAERSVASDTQPLQYGFAFLRATLPIAKTRQLPNLAAICFLYFFFRDVKSGVR